MQYFFLLQHAPPSQLHALLDDISKLLPWQSRWLRNNNCSSSEWNIKTYKYEWAGKEAGKTWDKTRTSVPSQNFHYQLGFISVSTLKTLRLCVDQTEGTRSCECRPTLQLVLTSDFIEHASWRVQTKWEWSRQNGHEICSPPTPWIIQTSKDHIYRKKTVACTRCFKYRKYTISRTISL